MKKKMNYNYGSEHAQCLSHSECLKKMIVFFIIILVSYHEHGRGTGRTSFISTTQLVGPHEGL